MDKQYRIINLNINKEDNTGIETLIAELSEIEIRKIPGLSFNPYIFGGTSGQIFILHPDSSLGKYLMNEPEEPKAINLSEFKSGTINLREGQREAYYHVEYIRRKSELLSANNIADFSYYADDSKKILADYYYKNKLTYNYDYNEDISDSIAEYKDRIATKPQHENVAWDYFNLAVFLTAARDFDGAKYYYLKSATEETILKADAYFSLGCLKTKLGEDGDIELQKAIHLYEKDKNEYSEYARAILSCSGIFAIRDTFKLSGEKRNGQITARHEDGYYSPAQVDISFMKINNFINRELRYADLAKRSNGFFEIEVAFIEGGEAPYNFISVCEISGFDFNELSQIIKEIYDLIPPNMK